jgi:membrane protease subunit (stomatin/prohibitin family)
MKENSVNIFEIDEHLETFSEALRERLCPDFDDYGMALERFFVTTVSKPEDNKDYKRFKNLYFRQYADVTEAKLKQQLEMINAQTEAQKMIIESQAIATKRTQEGYTYQQERGFDVASAAAENEAVGQFTNLGIGLGTMAGVGGTIGGMVSGALNGAVNSQGEERSVNGKFCKNCGAKIELNAKFCMECGTPVELVCAKCGNKIPVGAKFCMECGEKV